MDYKDYLEERMNGMYEILEESQSPVLEGFKKKKSEHEKICRTSFLNYLAYKYNDEDVKYEIKSAESDKEKLAVVKKYAKDYEDWKKRNRNLSLSWLGVAISITTPTSVPVAMLAVSMLLYGNIIRILLKDEKDRDDVGTEKYKQRNKK